MESPLQILLLEDCDTDAELIWRTLRRAGIECVMRRAVNEAEFRAAFAGARPHVVLSDYQVPLFRGDAALAFVQEISRELPVLFVSGAIGEELAVKLMRAGATDYVLKDQLERLPLALRRALAEAEEREARRQAEAALRESEACERARRAELETLMDAIPAAVFIAHDCACREMTGNRAAMELLRVPHGRSPSASAPEDQRLEYESWSNGRLLAPEELPMQRAAATGCAVAGVELDIIFPDGEKRYLFGSALPLFDDAGAVRGSVGAFVDIAARLAAEEAMQASLREKEVLLREVHHRVKNNLQIVSSLLNLQSRHLTDPAMLKVFADTRDRVRAMAAVHERLYESGNFAKIDFAAHLESLARMLMRAHSPAGAAIRPVLRLDPLTVDLNTAVPLSLIANELLTNALKYAFGERRGGMLTISLKAGGPHHELCIDDDGPGFSAGINPATSRTLGLRLVRDLSRQIRGELEIDSTTSGTHTTVRWPTPLLVSGAPIDSQII